MVESASELATAEDLRTLDSLHLAAAELVPGRDRILATWDQRLWRAGDRKGIRMLPADLP